MYPDFGYEIDGRSEDAPLYSFSGYKSGGETRVDDSWLVTTPWVSRMFLGLLILLIIPLVALVIESRASADRLPAGHRILLVGLLTGVGLVAAFPFLTNRGVGTGEAANYRLALADALTQVRAGHIPLVGETEYAFNGRVHPLRDAPYLFYLGAALDALTFRRLSFWQLQNLSLAWSFLLSGFTAYFGLRWATQCSRRTALFLATMYAWSPPVLAAGTVNLFMTVHAAALAPLAAAAVLCQVRGSRVRNDFIFAGAAGALWYAHAPVALWLTVVLGIVRLVILWRDPRWQLRWGLLAAAITGGLLVAFIVVSVRSLSLTSGGFAEDPLVHGKAVTTIMANLRLAFPGSILPVSARAASLGDLQLGYAGWLLFLWSLAELPRYFRAAPIAEKTAGAVRLALAGATVVLLLLVLPVPLITRSLWQAIPLWVEVITAVWPMQRLYLVAILLIVFSSAMSAGKISTATRRTRRRQIYFWGAALLWTGFQAARFAAAGVGFRWSAEDTRRSEARSNLDLTITSYALLPMPTTFVNGVMDPLFEFAILDADGRELDSNYLAGLRVGKVIAEGRLYSRSGRTDSLEISGGAFPLRFHKKYLAEFEFPAGPIAATVEILGPTLVAHYRLPDPGEPGGFGIGGQHRRAIAFSTSQPDGEIVGMRFLGSGGPAPHDAEGTVATFRVLEVDPDALPVVVRSWSPLRCTVNAPAPATMLQTPRGFIPGYTSSVNGRAKRVASSPSGQVAVAIRPGVSQLDLRYPGPPGLRGAFWVSVSAWIGLLLSPLVLPSLTRAFPRRNAPWWRKYSLKLRLPSLLFLLALVVAGLVTVQRRQHSEFLRSYGPLRVKFLMPTDKPGRSQPIVVTGKTGRGTIVFLTYTSKSTVQVSADIWGSLLQSPPIPIDYAQEQELVLNSSALYPLDHPAVRAMDRDDRERNRNDFSVQLNGETILRAREPAYESTVEEVTVGETRIGGSLTEPRFTGEILSYDRLPVPRRVVIAGAEKLLLRWKSPADNDGRRETLLSFGYQGNEGSLVIEYQENKKDRLLNLGADGKLISQTDLAGRTPTDRSVIIAFGDHPAAAQSFTPLQITIAANEVLRAPPGRPLARPIAIEVGENFAPPQGVEPRFTGVQLDAQIQGRSPNAKSLAATGAARMVLFFPTDKAGRAEPLLTTGKAGAGDFAYVIYLDANHAKFAVDHWGVGGAVGSSVALDYKIPHEIEVRTGALWPTVPDRARTGASKATPGNLLKSQRVFLDGQEVVAGNFIAYPTTAAEITPGENRIGGSGCDAKFTGEIESVTTGPQER